MDIEAKMVQMVSILVKTEEMQPIQLQVNEEARLILEFKHIRNLGNGCYHYI
jgi:hypothetical protein